jgi:hypothetical protein
MTLGSCYSLDFECQRLCPEWCFGELVGPLGGGAWWETLGQRDVALGRIVGPFPVFPLLVPGPG